MKRLFTAALLIVTGLMNLFPVRAVHSVNAQSAPAPQADSGLAVYPEWKMAQYGSGIGFTGLFAQDIDGDGAVEIVAGGNFAGREDAHDYWYVLRASGANTYRQVWFSEKFSSAIKRIALSDVDNDGTAEIFIGLADASIHVYRGTDYSEKAVFKAAYAMRSMLIADVDGNGSKELIISSDSQVTAYNTLTYEYLWCVNNYDGDVAVGNVDTDPGPEIVLSSGYVLDGATRAVEWHYTGLNGFGYHVEVGDIDGDGIEEIAAAVKYGGVIIFEADLKSPMWEIPYQDDVTALKIADTNGDQRAEVVLGEETYGRIRCVDGQTHKQLWEIGGAQLDVINIAVGDVDHDQLLEVLWGAGGTSNLRNYLYVADILSGKVEWQSEDLNGPYYAVDTGDVDDDGQPEIVEGMNNSSSGAYDSVLKVINPTTHEVEWQTDDEPNIRVTDGIQSVRIGDVDQDGQTEFLIATDGSGSGMIQIYNGRSHELERQSIGYFGTLLTAMEIGDVDGDGQIEIVVGQSARNSGTDGFHVVVYNGATAAEEWKSPMLDPVYGDVYDIELSDMDGDGRVEIIASALGKSVSVFDGVTHNKKARILTDAYAVSIADINKNGTPSILVGRGNGKVDLYNGRTYALESTISLGSGQISCLSWVDLNRDAVPEWLVCNANKLSIYSTKDLTLLWQSADLGTFLGMYNQAPVGQLDLDDDLEIAVGSDYTLFQFDVPWVGPFGLSSMKVMPQNAVPGDALDFTIVLSNQGKSNIANVQMDNPLPAELIYATNSLFASSGTAAYEDGKITWSGHLDIRNPVTLSYRANVKPDAPHASLVNSAQITSSNETWKIRATVHIPPVYMYVPLCFRDYCGDFYDSFSNPASGWLIRNDSLMRTEYVGGEYRILGKSPNYLYVIKAPTCKRQNYTVEVDARWAGNTGSGYGLVFGAAGDLSQYYFVMVNTDYQEYFLYYAYSAGFEKIAGNGSSAIHKGTASNHIKVNRNGSQITLDINGVRQGTWSDSRISGLTNVGLVNVPYSNVANADSHFDNFNVALQTGTAVSSSGNADPIPTAAAETADRASDAQPFQARRLDLGE